MTIKSCGQALSFLSLILAGLAAFAAPVEFNGHHYEVVLVDEDISWNDADLAANMSTFAGANGHLATLTTAEEDDFVEGLRAAVTMRELWIGGFQDECAPIDPECGWTWVNGEGPLEETLPDGYTNWLIGEPNDAYGPGSESHIAIGLGNRPGWNDEGAIGNVAGYVVEYDTETTIPAAQCLGSGCTTTPGQTLTFPPTVQLADDASIDVRKFEFTDDPMRCGLEKLVLFGSDTDPADEMPDLIIPPYLCGSPKFIVVAAETNGVELPQGTVLVENDTETALPDNLYDCDAPIVQNFPTEGDPQFQDVMAWQTTDAAEMLETDLGAGVFEGSLGEFTDSCGSSRGRVKSLSYYVIGLHIDFGPGFEWATSTAANHHMFVALTRYKMDLLLASVLESRPALNRLEFRILNALANTSSRWLDRGRFRASLLVLRLFLFTADNLVSYDPIPGENYNGEHIMRGGNIDFTLTNKVVPYAP